MHFNSADTRDDRKSLVIRQKGESQSGCYKKTKRAKCSKNQTFIIPWYTDVKRLSARSSLWEFIADWLTDQAGRLPITWPKTVLDKMGIISNYIYVRKKFCVSYHNNTQAININLVNKGSYLCNLFFIFISIFIMINCVISWIHIHLFFCLLFRISPFILD